jgi:hypothetical protein
MSGVGGLGVGFKTHIATSLVEFLNLLKPSGLQDPPVWFRGAKNAAYDLKPGLYRHKTLNDFQSLVALESRMLTAFRHRSPPFTQDIPTDQLALQFLMQHHGVPTRLLDWSESPFVALYFALEAYDDPRRVSNDVAVWVLDPVVLNRHSLKNTNVGILSAEDDWLQGLRPVGNNPTVSVSSPVAIFGIYNSRRIVAQRGVFVLYGNDVQSLEVSNATIAHPDLIWRVTIPAANKKVVFEQLFSFGITDSVIFQTWTD